MNSFLKSFFASFLAVIVALGVISVISTFAFLFFMGSMISKTTNTKTNIPIKPNTILRINPNAPITETLSDNPLDYLDISTMQFRPNLTSYNVIKTINIASLDSNIVGIYLDIPPHVMIDLANMEELRNALLNFKSTGKKIFSYADNYSQKSYLLSSIADSIYLCPIGGVEWKGVGGSSPFFKGALHKLGIRVEVFKYGKYKSAVEPFLLSEMSNESRLQTTMLYDNIWGKIVSNISASRDIDSTKLQVYASELKISDAQSAKELKFVDKLMYRTEAEEDIKSNYSNPNMVSLSDYMSSKKGVDLIAGKGSSKNQVEVIYADGEIISGKSGAGIIGDETLVKKIRRATDDVNVKAIVLRVNSPGGSALASDIIDKEVRRAKSKKPFIVSMGAYAASGGYYIASNADAIVASPFTLTGSIGVFGLTFEASQSIKENLGITFDVVKTNPYADMGSISRPMTDIERNYMQASVDKVYETFISCVSDGRDMTPAAVDAIAQGRVWSADKALEIGLIDMKGGLGDAISLAAQKADISDDYMVRNIGYQEDIMTTVLRSMNSETVKTLVQKALLPSNILIGTLSKELESLELMMKGDKIQAISPLRIEF